MWKKMLSNCQKTFLWRLKVADFILDMKFYIQIEFFTNGSTDVLIWRSK